MWQILFFALPPQIKAPNTIKKKYYDRPKIFYPAKVNKTKNLFMKH